MIEELEGKYEEVKKIIDVLPTNNKQNRKRKLDILNEEEQKDKKRIELLDNEISNRLSKFKALSINSEIKTLEEEKEKCNIINEWNTYNTSYEKMHLDYYLYQLHRYYKEDLKSVNICIKKIIDSFNKVEINLTKEDFDYNEYSKEYICGLLENKNEDELKELFENLYWKNPDILKIIELNFKSIYLRYEKKIDKYFESRHNEFLKSHKDSEIYDLRINITSKLKDLKNKDIFLNYQKFINEDYTIGMFKDIDSIKNKYFNENSYSFNNLIQLHDVLVEYNILLKYKYIFTDMKEKLNKKDELKNNKSNILKKIATEESKIKKLNSKQNKKSIFGKVKNNEKYLFQYKELLTNLEGFYNELDNARFDDLIYKKLSKDSLIIEILYLISSNYLYFTNKLYEEDDSLNINDINERFESLKEYVNTNNFYIINNIALLDERQMKELIVNKYNLADMHLEIDNLLNDNIINTIDNIELLINYEYIKSSGLNLDDISLLLEYEKIKEKINNLQE